jgi:ectoine hydroxylase-related dioxygenase (phytanoyl-CoA dioxygenase family)
MSIQNKYYKLFQKNGYCVVKNKISNKILKKIEKTFFITYSKFLNTDVNKKNYSDIVSDFEKSSKFDELYTALKKFSSSKEMLSLNKFFKKISIGIFKKNFKLTGTGMAIGLNNSGRTAYRWHQEKPYYPKIKTIHFQFPIFTECNKKNGTMSVLSGSNKEGFIKSVKNIKQHKKSINSLVPNNMKKLQQKYKEKFIKMKRKDFVLFHENIIHKTNKNTSNAIRLACIFRYEGNYECSLKKS